MPAGKLAAMIVKPPLQAAFPLGKPLTPIFTCDNFPVLFMV
jgi:hypothetical protein